MKSTPESAIHKSYYIVEQFVVAILIAVIFLVLFDLVLRYYEYQNQSKMTTQELKDEHKESEGNPDVKRRIRSMQFSILSQRISQSVPLADVIITNPTHYSVALKYEEQKDKAPKVVAKGKGELARQIKLIAITHALPIYEAPQLARALYRSVTVGHEVNPELYMAVAIVLSYIYQLKRYQQGMGQLPNRVDDLQIPAEFHFEE